MPQIGAVGSQLRSVDQERNPLQSRQRGPVLQSYFRRAPGARPHMAIDQHAPLAAFEAIATQIPVYRVRRLPD